MDRTAILTLISEEQVQDELGVWHTTTSERDVFCEVNSVTRSEFFEGGRNGLNPEFELRMLASDYDGERICVLNEKQYAIYRTYLRKDDMIELYVIRKGGTNG